MKTPVTVLSDMLRAIRDAEHAQRISETAERARRKAGLLRGGLTSGNKKQTETGFTKPVNEQKTRRDI
ncbi:replication protein for prophage CP-933T [Shigella sonnei]|nr:replication protein for prophage CP-933T [Shigella sonnei]